MVSLPPLSPLLPLLTLHAGLVNFEKREMIARIVTQFERFKQNRYQLAPEPLMQSYLQQLYILDEEALYAESLARESRDELAALKAKLEKAGKL